MLANTKQIIFRSCFSLTVLCAMSNNGIAQFPQQFPLGNIQGQNPGFFPSTPVFFAPVSGASYESLLISANANFMIARAQSMELIARANLINGHARIVHAEALAAEGKYFNDWVESRHELRRMQKEWIREQNPRMYERAEKADKVMHDIIEKQPKYVIEKLDITNRLNYMFGHVTTELYAQEIVNAGAIFGGQMFNSPLTPDDISEIYVQKVETIGGKAIRFKLERLSLGDQEFPYMFNRPGLREPASAYHNERARILGLIGGQGPKPRYEEYMGLKETLDNLEDALEKTLNVYARTDPNVLHQYHVGLRFIHSQVAGITHAMRTGETEHLTGLPQFNGQRLGELLDFMVKNGLEFSRPEYTGKPTYERLFLAMRGAYLDTRN